MGVAEGVAERPTRAQKAWSLVGILACAGALFGCIVLIVSSNPYTPIWPTVWQDKATDLGVTIVWEDGGRNCGAADSPNGQGGCFLPSRPDRVYVSTGLGDRVGFFVLHELAHAWQNQHDLPYDECQADLLAISWGAEATADECGARSSPNRSS